MKKKKNLMIEIQKDISKLLEMTKQIQEEPFKLKTMGMAQIGKFKLHNNKICQEGKVKGKMHHSK